MSKITKIVARQIFDSRGNPTIEAEVFANNMRARAICPSGASTGSHEAYEKRDVSNKKYSVGPKALKYNDQLSAWSLFFTHIISGVAPKPWAIVPTAPVPV